MRVFIGYDKNETVAAQVCSWSIVENSSKPVSITFLKLDQLPLKRERDQHQSTDFAFSRFLVPYLCDYSGPAVFMDCDMLVRSDIVGLFELNDTFNDVMVVKHDYKPKTGNKFLNQRQSIYKRKNWSSVMLFNCSDCKILTPQFVDSVSGLYLHQFQWTDHIGEIPKEWNHLVGEYEHNPQAKLVHFTLGTPCFARYSNCEFSQEWRDCKTRMLHYKVEGEYLEKEEKIVDMA